MLFPYICLTIITERLSFKNRLSLPWWQIYLCTIIVQANSGCWRTKMIKFSSGATSTWIFRNGEKYFGKYGRPPHDSLTSSWKMWVGWLGPSPGLLTLPAQPSPPWRESCLQIFLFRIIISSPLTCHIGWLLCCPGWTLPETPVVNAVLQILQYFTIFNHISHPTPSQALTGSRESRDPGILSWSKSRDF